jgi:hypothetical protein
MKPENCLGDHLQHTDACIETKDMAELMTQHASLPFQAIVIQQIRRHIDTPTQQPPHKRLIHIRNKPHIWQSPKTPCQKKLRYSGLQVGL